MTFPTVLDATHLVPPAQAKAAGVIAEIGYNPFNGDSWKTQKPSDVQALHAVGMGAGAVSESTIDMMKQGYQACHDMALRANAALDRAGYPGWILAAWACDTDASYAQIRDGVHGWHDGTLASGTRRDAGGYGSAPVIDGAFNDGFIIEGGGWETNASSWSHGEVSPHATLLQGLPVGDYDPDFVLRSTRRWLWFPGDTDPRVPVVPPRPPLIPLVNIPYPKDAPKDGFHLGGYKGPDVAQLNVMLLLMGVKTLDFSTQERANTYTQATRDGVFWAQTIHDQHETPKWKPSGRCGPLTWAWIMALCQLKHAGF